jgi:hypothetical protein
MPHVPQRRALSVFVVEGLLLWTNTDLGALRWRAEKGTQERPEIAASRDRREIVELREHAAPRERHENADRKRRRPNSSAGHREAGRIRMIRELVERASRANGVALGLVDDLGIGGADPAKFVGNPPRRLGRRCWAQGQDLDGAFCDERGRVAVTQIEQQFVEHSESFLKRGQLGAEFIRCIEGGERTGFALPVPFCREWPHPRVEDVPSERLEVHRLGIVVDDLPRRREQRVDAVERRLLGAVGIAQRLCRDA